MTVAVAMIQPKHPRNVGTAVRACSCYGVPELLVTGTRVRLDAEKGKGYRLPREERMRGGRCVHVRRVERPVYECPGLTPVAIELIPGTQLLPHYKHPEHALYIVGPEDGSIPKGILSACHDFVRIPMLHCANVASAIYMVLNDRHTKRVLDGLESPLELQPEGQGEADDAAVW